MYKNIEKKTKLLLKDQVEYQEGQVVSKETDVLRDMLDGINPDSKNMTINDLYCRWKQVKHGLGSIPKFV